MSDGSILSVKDKGNLSDGLNPSMSGPDPINGPHAGQGSEDEDTPKVIRFYDLSFILKTDPSWRQPRKVTLNGVTPVPSS